MSLIKPLEITAVVKPKSGETPDFASLIKHICTLSNVHELSYILHHFIPFTSLHPMDINIFRVGIKPMWEDLANINGAKYIIRLRKECGQRIFEKVLLSFVNEDFKSLEVNGLVMAMRPKQYILGIWVRNNPTEEQDKMFCNEISNSIGVNFDMTIEFKLNDESIKDNSSFRNTSIHKKIIHH